MGDEPYYTCPFCGRKSYHPQDLANRYCSCCGSADSSLPKLCPHAAIRARAWGYHEECGGECPHPHECSPDCKEGVHVQLAYVGVLGLLMAARWPAELMADFEAEYLRLKSRRVEALHLEGPVIGVPPLYLPGAPETVPVLVHWVYEGEGFPIPEGPAVPGKGALAAEWAVRLEIDPEDEDDLAP